MTHYSYKRYIDQKLIALNKSKFRRNQKLSRKLTAYAREKGLATLEKHAWDLLSKRLFPEISNFKIPDGKQTPYRNHPVFLAQHGTGTCCRKCLWKWHRISTVGEIPEKYQHYIIAIIIEWLRRKITN
jgi:hypothetical protein